jgi:hypothetical protein
MIDLIKETGKNVLSITACCLIVYLFLYACFNVIQLFGIFLSTNPL